jgi:hypothetical protein
MKIKRFQGFQWLNSLRPTALLPAAEKIGYTTLGILLALWVNNCDEGRKKLEIEQKTMKELYAGMEQDRKDVEESIAGYEYRLWNINTIFDFLGRDTIPQDSLSQRINDLIGFSYLLANTAAYETLKSRGLETITTDSLRLGIATLYDVDYEAIQTTEKYLNDLNNTLLIPHIVSNLRLGADQFTPEEITKIKADRYFQQVIWQLKFFNQAALVRYQHSLKNLKSLMREIEMELNSGRF